MKNMYLMVKPTFQIYFLNFSNLTIVTSFFTETEAVVTGPSCYALSPLHL